MLIAPFDETVLERIVTETRGNPLALLELPRGLSPTELAGGFGLPASVPLSAGIENSFTKRLSALPEDARRLLLVAAADPVGEPSLVWRAAERLGIPESAADIVESEELLELGTRVVVRHPLVRSAVYRAATSASDERSTTRSPRQPTRNSIRIAVLGTGRRRPPSPTRRLQPSWKSLPSRAQARGGLAAAAAFLDRASALTPDESTRSERALAAAQAKLQAGALEDALRLLATAEAGPLTEVQLARAALLRGQISFASTHSGDAATLLLDAAERYRDMNPELARETYLEALTAAVFAGSLAHRAHVRRGRSGRECRPASQRATRARPVARRFRSFIQRLIRACRASSSTGPERNRGHVAPVDASPSTRTSATEAGEADRQ